MDSASGEETHFKLPIVTIIFNNDALGWIMRVQKKRYDQNYVSTAFSHVDCHGGERLWCERLYGNDA